MSLIPEEALRRSQTINLAPMVDFLFLIIALFATMVIGQATLYETEVNLVQMHSPQEKRGVPDLSRSVHIGITKDGIYRWLSAGQELSMDDPQLLRLELQRRQQMGLLPADPGETTILLHIDNHASWEPIARGIFAIREAGFLIHPVYRGVESYE